MTPKKNILVIGAFGSVGEYRRLLRRCAHGPKTKHGEIQYGVIGSIFNKLISEP